MYLRQQFCTCNYSAVYGHAWKTGISEKYGKVFQMDSNNRPIITIADEAELVENKKAKSAIWQHVGFVMQNGAVYQT